MSGHTFSQPNPKALAPWLREVIQPLSQKFRRMPLNARIGGVWFWVRHDAAQ
jgi:hypothetical protein